MNDSSIDRQEIEKFEQYAEQWWDLKGPLRTLHDINPARLAFIQSWQSLKGKKLLDVGCGGGILTEAMARAGAHCTGLDAEAQAIETAKKHAQQEGLSIRYQCQALETFEENGFDIVTCMEMLEHVQQPALVIAHCKRVLKKDGLLFLSTINRNWKAYAAAIIAAEYVLKLLPVQTHDYKQFIKPSELAAILRAEELDLLECKGMHYNPLSGTASLVDDISVNYLLVCRKVC